MPYPIEPGPEIAGNPEVKRIDLAGIILDFVLGDDRFGINLERVKMAAAIAGAVDTARNEATHLRLEDAQYAIVREVIEHPTKPYNPSIARHLLPLLQHLLDAGQKA